MLLILKVRSDFFYRTYDYRANDSENHEDLEVDLKLVVFGRSFDIKKNGNNVIDSGSNVYLFGF